jgi:hypothetical protein
VEILIFIVRKRKRMAGSGCFWLKKQTQEVKEFMDKEAGNL